MTVLQWVAPNPLNTRRTSMAMSMYDTIPDTVKTALAILKHCSCAFSTIVSVDKSEATCEYRFKPCRKKRSCKVLELVQEGGQVRCSAAWEVDIFG